MTGISVILSGLVTIFGFVIVFLWALIMVAVDWEEIYFLFYRRCYVPKVMLSLLITVHYVFFTPWLNIPFVLPFLIEGGIVIGLILLILFWQVWNVGWSVRGFCHSGGFALFCYGGMLLIEALVRGILVMLN